MPTREAPGLDASGQAPIFAALGDEMRLRIVLRLVDEGPQSITRLTEGTAVTRQAITKHLVVLENAGIVRGKTRGREHLWEVELARLADARVYPFGTTTPRPYGSSRTLAASKRRPFEGSFGPSTRKP